MQGIDRTLECFRPRLGGARRRFAHLSVLGRGCFAEFLHLLAKTRQQFHVALSTLNFLVENYAVESFVSYGQFLRQIEMRLGRKPKTVDVLMNEMLGFLDSL